MGNELQLLNYSDKKIRTVIIGGVVWWVAKDVCLLLGYKNTNAAIGRHCRGVAKQYPIVDSIGRSQDTRIINISDLTRLINGSELPEAEQFEQWVHEDVLPSVLKTGSYSITNPTPAIPRSFSEALQLAADQAKLIEQMQPKVSVYDRIVDATNSLPQTHCAKLFNINPKIFIQWLKSIGADYKNNTQVVREKYLKNGWFVQKIFPQEVTKNGKTEIRNRLCARITAKGLAGLEKLAKEQGLIPQDYKVEFIPEPIEESPIETITSNTKLNFEFDDQGIDIEDMGIDELLGDR